MQRTNIRVVFLGEDITDLFYENVTLEGGNFLVGMMYHGIRKNGQDFTFKRHYFDADKGEVVIEYVSMEQALKAQEEELAAARRMFGFPEPPMKIDKGDLN